MHREASEAHDLVVDLVAPEAVERLPEPGWTLVRGARVPRIALAPFESSAPAKVRLAATAARNGHLGIVAQPAAEPASA